MTSRRQQRQEQYDHLLPFIQEAADEYYGGNLDRGFRHWAFATVFALGPDIQGNDIVKYTAIDGSDDFEIDGYFIPEADDDSVVNLFQSKYRQPGTTMGAGELAKFLNSPIRIASPGEVAHSHNEETKALHDHLIELLRPNPTPSSINLVWATSGTLSAAARRHIDENRSRRIILQLGDNPVEITVTLQCWDLDSLYEEHRKQQESDDTTNSCDHEFRLEPGTYHETGVNAEYPTLYMTVPVTQIIDVFARHNYKIFGWNPRGPLGNKVNQSIKRTLLDEIDRKRFHLLNNGITAICDSWRLDGNTLSVKDFQIVNGCQTTVTLWDVRAELRNDPGVMVTVKLTSCPPHFWKTIALYTNRQTPLRAEDFTSNDQIQGKLQRQFAEMTPPWFYEIKRGEWSKMLGGPSVRNTYQEESGRVYRKLTSKEVAQAVVAFAGFPGEAKDKIRNFLNKEPLSPIAREEAFSYDKIYTEDVAAPQLFLPALIQRYVWQQVSQDKDSHSWLDYARYHLVWLIGETLREHYRLESSLFPASRAATVAMTIDDWFKPLYDVAVVAIQNTVQGSDRGGQFREFFRSAANYRSIETNLHGALRLASNFGNPTANLPA